MDSHDIDLEGISICYRKQETVSTWATGEANEGGEEEDIATCGSIQNKADTSSFWIVPLVVVSEASQVGG